MTEREFQREVIRYARSRGWMVAHFGNSVKIVRQGSTYKTIPDPDAAGFPDLVMARRGRLVFAELKAKGKKPTEKQRAWLDVLESPNHEVYVWQPDAMVEIERILE